MEIGREIKRLREEYGISQSQLAGQIMSKSLISRIENGNVNPSLKTLTIIAKNSMSL